MEVVPGIHRIESVLGPRPFSQYLLRGERTVLVDSGVRATPQEVILPWLDERRIDPGEIDLVLVSHADVDHFGGNAAIRAASPSALVCAHAADVHLIESAERTMRERYGWYEEFGIGYPEETTAWLRESLGEDVPVDVVLVGGERIRIGPGLTVDVLHLPGHSAGHLGLWDARSRTAIVMDAVMAGGLLDTEGAVVHPPPIPDVGGYESSVRLLHSLGPERLLTAHYDMIEGPAVARFLDESLAFVERARRIVAEAPQLPLDRLLERADRELGPFTSMPNELAATLRGCLEESGREPR